MSPVAFTARAKAPRRRLCVAMSSSPAHRNTGGCSSKETMRMNLPKAPG
jgi:hypothetical protein